MDQPVRLEGWDAGAVSISGVGRPSTKRQTPPSHGKYGFNFHFFRGVVKLGLMGEKVDILLVVGLIGFICANLYVGSLSGKVTGQFYGVIVDKKWEAFLTVLWKSALVVIGSAILETIIKFNLDILGYRWRKNIVRNLHQRYFSDSMFYQLLHLDGTIDNPDQRITQDLDLLTRSMGAILRVVIEGPLQIIYYSYLSISTLTWQLPLLILGYWIVAYVVNKLLMTPSARYVFRQEQLEGYFRFGHVRVRTHSESIALNGAGKREQDIANVTFASLMKNRWYLISWETAVSLSTNIFAYFASVINYAIVSIPIFKGWKIPGSAGGVATYVSNASFRLIMLINGFTQFNNISRDLSDFIGYSNRVAQLFEVIDKLQNSEVSRHLNDSERSDPYFALHSLLPASSQRPPASPSLAPVSRSPSPPPYPLSINQEPAPLQQDGLLLQAPIIDNSAVPTPEIAFHNVSVYTPAGQTLIKNLNISIPSGKNLLITGPNGSGKSSLIRCLSGLWRTFDGNISRPGSVLFLPQKPYLPYGNLHDQIMYPLTTANALLGLPENQRQSTVEQIQTEQLLDILRDVELQYLATRPEIADSLSIATRETLRNIIEEQDGDSMNLETTGLLAAVARQHDMSSDTASILNEIQGSNLNWTEVLSPGEQQRIGLARVLYHKPCFAILDESTSSVDEALEEKFYKLCRKNRITVITIGHKSSLKRFHQMHLEVDRKGRCSISELN